MNENIFDRVLERGVFIWGGGAVVVDVVVVVAADIVIVSFDVFCCFVLYLY